MDNELLRQQITDEIQAEFETKLRQLRRLKEQAEAELEASTERWRLEKRRLNGEIDRLETALVEAKAAAGRKSLDEEQSPGLDPAAIAKLQQAADERLKNATAEWETERTRLKSQINRLEGAVAEAIARASNPMRSTQPVKEQFEADLNRVTKEKTELEQALLRGKTEWEQEKLKMTGEMVKLRRAAQIMGRPVPKEDTPAANPKVRDLENQLQESFTKWTAEREQLVAQIRKLEDSSRHWDTERRQLNDHAGQLQQAFVQAQAQIQTYEVAARSSKPAEAQIEQLRRERDALQKEFQDARNAWSSERHQLNTEIERMAAQIQRVSGSGERVSNQIVDQLRMQYEERLQEAIQQKTQLAQQLQSASSLLETERTRLSAAQANGESGMDKSAITAEVARVEGLITEIVGIIDDKETELSTVIRKNVEKVELDAYLRGILFALGRKKQVNTP
jgi:chromosome segregation ATPase